MKIYCNNEDGHGYFKFGHEWRMVPQNIDKTFDMESVQCVSDMASNGVGEEDIARVQQFISSLEERA